MRQLDTTVVNYDIDRVVHFAALLSAVAEQNVARGLQVPHNARPPFLFKATVRPGVSSPAWPDPNCCTGPYCSQYKHLYYIACSIST